VTTDPTATEPTPETQAEIADAMAPTVGRLYAESLRVANDETLQRLGQKGIQVGRGDILHMHLSVLLDTLFGDIDDPRRQEYEVAVHTKLAEAFAEVEQQAARMTLLQGVQHAPGGAHPPARFDASQLPRPKRRR
jgi:hypothetical protein